MSATNVQAKLTATRRAEGSFGNGFYDEPHAPQFRLPQPPGNPLPPRSFWATSFGGLVSIVLFCLTGLIAISMLYAQSTDTRDIANKNRSDIIDVKVFIARQDQVNQYLASNISDIRNDVRSIRNNAR